MRLRCGGIVAQIRAGQVKIIITDMANGITRARACRVNIAGLHVGFVLVGGADAVYPSASPMGK